MQPGASGAASGSASARAPTWEAATASATASAHSIGRRCRGEWAIAAIMDASCLALDFGSMAPL
ncbi:hypothetical protein D3C72_2427250 [compost metagenome]